MGSNSLRPYCSVKVHVTQKCGTIPCGRPAPRRHIKLDGAIRIKLRIVEIDMRKKQGVESMTGTSPVTPGLTTTAWQSHASPCLGVTGLVPVMLYTAHKRLQTQ